MHASHAKGSRRYDEQNDWPAGRSLGSFADLAVTGACESAATCDTTSWAVRQAKNTTINFVNEVHILGPEPLT